MAKNDFTQYNIANEYVMNKDRVISSYIQYMLSRTQSMFAYAGLPDTIPASKLEMMLQTKGYAFITDVEGELYALYGGLGGEPDVYGEPTKITIANPALKLSKEYTLATDGVLVNNDALRIGILPILNKYGALLTENTISMRTVDIILRMVMMISASDDRTFTGAEKFIRDIENGKISAIGESAFFDGVKVHSVSNSQNYLNQFIEYEQYLKASCFNELGLNANYNMKSEKISTSEAAMNDDFLLPLVDNMIKERQTAIDAINEKYGTEITIDYASAWKVTHEENVKQVAISESIAEQAEQGSVDMELRQTEGAHDINKPVITIEGCEGDGTSESENGTTENDTRVSEGMEQKDDAGETPDSNEESNGETTSEGETESSERSITSTSENTESNNDDTENEDDADETTVKDGEDDDRNKS